MDYHSSHLAVHRRQPYHRRYYHQRRKTPAEKNDVEGRKRQSSCKSFNHPTKDYIILLILKY